MIGSRQRREASPTAPTQLIPFPARIDDTSADVKVTDVDWPAAARWWFAALDGKALGDGANTWTVHVVGTHLDGSDLWIQLQSADDPSHGFVLHVVRGTAWHEAMSRLPPTRDR